MKITIQSGCEERCIEISDRLLGELMLAVDLDAVTSVKAAISGMVAQRLWEQGKSTSQVAGWLTAEINEEETVLC